MKKVSYKLSIGCIFWSSSVQKSPYENFILVSFDTYVMTHLGSSASWRHPFLHFTRVKFNVSSNYSIFQTRNLPPTMFNPSSFALSLKIFIVTYDNSNGQNCTEKPDVPSIYPGFDVSEYSLFCGILSFYKIYKSYGTKNSHS